MAHPVAIILYDSPIDQANASQFCLHQHFDYMEEMVGGNASLLLYQPDEVQVLVLFNMHHGMLYTMYTAIVPPAVLAGA